MNKIFRSQNISIVTPPPATDYFLAGTSPDGKILQSIDDGSTWTDTSVSFNGNPKCFTIDESGNIYCGTSTGYVYKYSGSSWDSGTSIFGGNITALSSLNVSGLNFILIGDENGVIKFSIDLGGSWDIWNTVTGAIINGFITDGTTVYAITSTGIYYIDIVPPTQLQSGNFVALIHDVDNGFVYAATSGVSYIWKNTITNDFTAWTNLGYIIGGSSVDTMLKNGNRIIIGSGYYTFYTDDYFLNMDMLDATDERNISSANKGDIIIFGNDYNGHIWRSINNGLAFNDLGQQFSQTDINCLIYVP